ncbi:hypothetical protein K504DRAFT_461119 [Pleomassaria siparia CBS 279.74]|uniref:GRIP domain-containing protein n=1 Tax=Pleomassaria siparia CBS 279.74 TaxID=1314801 RepID=A0A6G1JWK2_9PLEO|nr:hypothetical protein K504DRAFT_461119 [Pleomassaria siparia CBS 279.74]
MSASTNPDPLKESGAAAKSRKKKNKKKGGGGGGGAVKTDESANVNGDRKKSEAEDDEDDEDVEDVEQEEETVDEKEHTKKPAAQSHDPDDSGEEDDHPLSPTTQTNGNKSHSISSAVALGLARSRSQGGLSPSPPPSDAAVRLEALAKERDALRQEVTELRKSLQGIQEKHEDEISSLQGELEETTESKEHFETQYKNLLGRVNTIKTSLGDRLKADAAKIEEFQAQITNLEEQNRELQENTNTFTEELARLRQENEAQTREVTNLRSRANLSQQNWIKERDDLISREAYAKEEFENAKQAMQDWEVLAMNERSLRESIAEREAELKDQLESQREAYAKAAAERDTNGEAVDGLQKALQEMQNARKLERRELVETAQAQLDDLRKQLQVAEQSAASSKTALETTLKDLERALPFEKEVKEKNLLIGKLRHEAVTLNEHLTKALRILKKGRPEENVDRQIVTNYILHFLAIDRSDPKKFEALQLIASLLGWTDEQREQAGLTRPGASNNSLRIPLSPFRRTPSTPSLNSALNDPMLSGPSNKESLADLWSDFLEREAGEGGGRSRRGSQATSPPSRSNTNSGLGISEN